MQEHSCDTCRFYSDCAVRLFLGDLPGDCVGYEPSI